MAHVQLSDLLDRIPTTPRQANVTLALLSQHVSPENACPHLYLKEEQPGFSSPYFVTKVELSESYPRILYDKLHGESKALEELLFRLCKERKVSIDFSLQTVYWIQRRSQQTGALLFEPQHLTALTTEDIMSPMPPEHPDLLITMIVSLVTMQNCRVGVPALSIGVLIQKYEKSTRTFSEYVGISQTNEVLQRRDCTIRNIKDLSVDCMLGFSIIDGNCVLGIWTRRQDTRMYIYSYGFLSEKDCEYVHFGCKPEKPKYRPMSFNDHPWHLLLATIIGMADMPPKTLKGSRIASHAWQLALMKLKDPSCAIDENDEGARTQLWKQVIPYEKELIILMQQAYNEIGINVIDQCLLRR